MKKYIQKAIYNMIQSVWIVQNIQIYRDTKHIRDFLVFEGRGNANDNSLWNNETFKN